MRGDHQNLVGERFDPLDDPFKQALATDSFQSLATSEALGLPAGQDYGGYFGYLINLQVMVSQSMVISSVGR